MAHILINAIFNIVTTISQAILTPFISVLFALFPDLSTQLGYVLQWFGMAIQYLTCVYRWFLFTPEMFVVLFDFFALRFTIFVLSSSIRAAIKLWNDLKP